MFFTLYNFIIQCSRLFKTSVPYSEMIRIFISYSTYTFLALIPLIPKPKNIHFLGFKISGLNYQNLHFLIGEVFVKNEYFFQANTSRPVILDCGSNIGVSILYFKYLYPLSRIYAFEPDPETFQMLKKNIKQNNLKNVTLYNQAVSDKKELIKFYISHDAGSLMMSTLKERMGDIEIKVEAISLAKFIMNKEIDFMKMDIEGSEDKVLADIAKRGLLTNIHEFILEYHHNIPENQLTFSRFLGLLDPQFTYQLDTSCIPLYKKDSFQDILVYGYRKQMIE